MTDQEKGSDGSMLTDVQKMTLRFKLVETATSLIGIPYIFGAEWENFLIRPAALDCSELTEGTYNLNGLRLPDGSQNQFDYTMHTPNPKIGDLAFFGRGGKQNQIYHVGIISSELNIVEARGFDPAASFETGKVIFRARDKWENYKNFVGYRSHPKLV